MLDKFELKKAEIKKTKPCKIEGLWGCKSEQDLKVGDLVVVINKKGYVFMKEITAKSSKKTNGYFVKNWNGQVIQSYEKHDGTVVTETVESRVFTRNLYHHNVEQFYNTENNASNLSSFNWKAYPEGTEVKIGSFKR
tara:strand:+ start:2068 stop:2478 length:411 start_codon:yes stop_codon:yes gene_type:complete